jgi:hypothetical protein
MVCCLIDKAKGEIKLIFYIGLEVLTAVERLSSVSWDTRQYAVLSNKIEFYFICCPSEGGMWVLCVGNQSAQEIYGHIGDGG